MRAVARDSEGKDVRFARVPTGPETCGFRFMLTSRGFVYRSAGTVGVGPGHYHCGCNCRVVAGFGGSKGVEGYDLEGIQSRYREIRDSIGARGDGLWDEFDALPAEERARYGKSARNGKDAYNGYVAHRIAAEAETRDPGWLYDGTVPEVGFASEQVRARATEQELRTAARLAAHGVRPTFVQDYEWVTGEDGRKRKAGLPDLAGGIEIKTLGSSGNAYGAVDNYLDSASGKRGLRCVVIDNTDSERITDEQLKAQRQRF